MKRDLRRRVVARWLRRDGRVRGFHIGGNWRGAINFWAHFDGPRWGKFFRRKGLALKLEPRTTYVDLSKVERIPAWDGACRDIERLPGWVVLSA